MMKLLKGLLITIVFIAVFILLGKNFIAKTALAGGIKVVTGLNAQVGGMEVGVLKPVVGIQNLQIMNPSGYSDPVMVRLKEFLVDYDLKSILAGKIHLRRLKLDLDEVTIVKREDGQINIQQIKALQEKPEPAKPTEQKTAGKAPEFRIDALELRIGKVIFKDYTRKPVSEKIFDVAIDERHENIGNPYSLAGLIVLKIMSKTGLAAITNINVGDLQAGVNDALKASAEQFTKGLGSAQEMGKSMLNNTSEILANPKGVTRELGNTGKQAASAAQDAAGSLKKLFKNQP